MSYCLNPICQKPKNPLSNKFCHNCGSKLLLAARYRALKPIGQGGFSRTFLAVDESKTAKPRCIIKQFLPKAANRAKASELFCQEAVRLEKLGSLSQIPELLAHIEQDNHQYLVQEYIDGQSLAQELLEEGAFSEAQIRQMLQDLLPVLQFIHNGQVIHRDIKPENIIRRFPKGDLVLVDFGAAKVITGTALVITGTVIGTPGYAAPEQAIGKATFASDIYSLGVTCIHLLTHVDPFELYSVSEGAWIWRDFLPSPVSESLGRVIDKMLEQATKRRYQSALEVLQDLNSSPCFPENGGMFHFTASPRLNVSASFTASFTWRLAATIKAHSGFFRRVHCLAFNPDGETLASGSDDCNIKLWKPGSGELLMQVYADSLVFSLAFSPDGQILASGDYNKNIKLWNPRTGSLKATLSGHTDSVTSVAFRPDGKTLASGSRDNNINLWLVEGGKLLGTFYGHSNWVESVAFSPDAQILVSGADDNTIKLWDLHDGRRLETLCTHTDYVRSVAFSPHGKHFASASNDRTVKIWKFDRGQVELLHNLCGHTKRVIALAFSPNGEILASVSADKTIKIWNYVTGKLLQTLEEHTDTVTAIAFSPDGNTLASGCRDGRIFIWRCNKF
jgi:WD40 repeat protein